MSTSSFLSACHREPTSYTPIWLMRQAGRYLPGYRRLREQAGSFWALCETPELAVSVSLEPVHRFGLDAAIIFSDIMILPRAMGLDVEFTEGKGPVVQNPVREKKDIDRLCIPHAEESYPFLPQAISALKEELGTTPLIGFTASPFTLACYMAEGQGKGDFLAARALCHRAPDIFSSLIEKNEKAVIACLVAQVQAGADAVMLFDTWGGLLPHALWQKFSLAPMRRVIEALAPLSVPVIVFVKGAGAWLEDLGQSGAQVVGLDTAAPLDRARALLPQAALQGNLDPAALLAGQEAIEREAAQLLEAHGPSSGHIFNLGHGVLPQTPPDAVARLVDFVHEKSARLRA